MAWSHDFLAYIEGDRRAEVWLVEVYQSGSEPGADGYTMSSCAGYGDEVRIAGPPRISGGRVTPVAWSSTIGACSIPLVGPLTTAMQHLARGTVCRVLLAHIEPGIAPVWEVIFWGQVWSITGGGVSYALELRDPLQAIDGRMARDVPALFQGLPNTYLTADPGAGGVTLNVGSTGGWTWDQLGEGIGLVKIDSEYITFTGLTATTFTGCTRGALGTPAAAHPTPVYDIGPPLVQGATVSCIPYLKGHPLDIVRRVLLSHPDAGNSEWDDYPVNWGLGIRQTLVDIDDIGDWKRDIVKVASGTYQWGVVSETIQESPGSWLTGMLSRAGLFLTTRHGLLTCRAATSPLITIGDPPLLGLTITDTDIVAGWAAITTEAWASEYSVEYLLVSATTEASSSTTAASGDGSFAATLPAARLIDYDVSDLVRSNEAEVQTEMLNRLALMAQRIPEAITFTSAGMRLAQLTPGDVVYFSSARAGIRWTYTDGTVGRRCWVAQVSPDWSRNTVQVRLLAYPATSDVFES